MGDELERGIPENMVDDKEMRKDDEPARAEGARAQGILYLEATGQHGIN
jgi:hypothetical protein